MTTTTDKVAVARLRTCRRPCTSIRSSWSWQDLQPADGLIPAVARKEFLALPGEALNSKMTKPACLVDVKSKLDLNALKKAGVAVWRL